MTTLCKDKNAAEKSYEDVTKQFEDKKSTHRNKMAVLTSKLNSLGFHSLQFESRLNSEKLQNFHF